MQDDTQNGPHDDVLSVVEEVHSAMEHTDPAYWSDQAAALISTLWSRLLADARPAALTSLTRQGSGMFGDALDRLIAVDPRAAVPLMRDVLGAITDRLRA